MCSSFPRICFVTALLVVTITAVAQQPITFCADPDNAPFSSVRKNGLENKIAILIGRELKRPVRFHWSRMGRGFVREVMNKGACDALASVPVGMRGMLVTTPYYRSTYVFVTRREEKPVRSFDDPRLRNMKIGVQVLDDDYAPPAQALARRQITTNIVGFEMDSADGKIISDVANRKIDTAIVWGPLAGFYAKRFGNRLRLDPVTPETDPPKIPFTFEIGVGVRKSDPQLLGQINDALRRAQPRIDQVLADFNVPVLPLRADRSERAGMR